MASGRAGQEPWRVGGLSSDVGMTSTLEPGQGGIDPRAATAHGLPGR